MKTINSIITVALVLLIAVVVYKSADHRHHFRNDAKKWASGSISNSNLINSEALEKMSGNKLLIALDKKSAMDNSISIAPDRILDKENFEKINQSDGPVILISGDISESARIWMLLSQMGIRDLYILAI